MDIEIDIELGRAIDREVKLEAVIENYVNKK